MFRVGSAGPIAVPPTLSGGILALGTGAAGGAPGAHEGTGAPPRLAGPRRTTDTTSQTPAPAATHSEPHTKAFSDAAIGVNAHDSSWINATAGAVALSLAFAQSTAVAVALGISLTINTIDTTTLAKVEDSKLDSDGAITVHADGTGRIDSLAFGISLAVAISLDASAISVAATGAVSLNDITSVVEATIANTTTSATHTVSAGGRVSVTASNTSTLKAIAIAASASISGSINSLSVSISLGLALAHNRVEKSVTASVVGITSF